MGLSPYHRLRRLLGSNSGTTYDRPWFAKITLGSLPGQFTVKKFPHRN